MSNDRLQELSSELNSILEARMQQLRSTLEENEGLTRKIVSAELEIARSRALRERLDGEIAGIDSDLEAMKARADEIRVRHASRVSERDQLRAEVDRIEQERGELEAEVEQLRETVRGAQESFDELSAECKGLEAKNEELASEIERMRKLRADLMSSLQQNMSKITGAE